MILNINIASILNIGGEKYEEKVSYHNTYHRTYYG